MEIIKNIKEIPIVEVPSPPTRKRSRNSTKLTDDSVTEKVEAFIAQATAAQERMLAREKKLESQFKSAERFIETELDKIHSIVNIFQEILDAAGAKEWRTAIQNIHLTSAHQTERLEHTLEAIQGSVKKACTQLEIASTHIVKNTIKTLQNANTDEIAELAETSSEKIKAMSDTALHGMANILKWFHWKNLAIVILLSTTVTFMIGLYTNDEWPWEAHNVIQKQRIAGQAVLSVWPQLSLTDQEQILSNVG